MREVTTAIAQVYRPACTLEVLSWSFGAVKEVKQSYYGTHWRDMRNTLDDDAIFGSRESYVCSCGTYSGKRYEGLICQHCGVKVTDNFVRSVRFAHIPLESPICHPYEPFPTDLQAIPVLPARLRETIPSVDELYEKVIVAVDNAAEAQRGFDSIVALLFPMFVKSVENNDGNALTLGMAIAFTQRRQVAETSAWLEGEKWRLLRKQKSEPDIGRQEKGGTPECHEDSA